MLLLGTLEVLMSVDVPGVAGAALVEPVALGVVVPVLPLLEPEAPMDVPLPVLEDGSVEVVLGVVAAVLGEAGVVVVEVVDEVEVSVVLRSPQAARVRAAIRARAAQRAMGVVFMRFSFKLIECLLSLGQRVRCLQATLGSPRHAVVGVDC